MGDVCFPWTVRAVVVILAILSCTVCCVERPAATVEKVYPRGNNWAVGHLMGKKSIEGLPGPQDNNLDSDYSTPTEGPGRLLHGTKNPLKSVETFLRVLVHPERKKQMPSIADELLLLRGRWSKERRDNS